MLILTASISKDNNLFYLNEIKKTLEELYKTNEIKFCIYADNNDKFTLEVTFKIIDDETYMELEEYFQKEDSRKICLMIKEVILNKNVDNSYL